ncbi:MAG: xanthine permease, partial [Alphaproteobacteria bacterium]|nr:xanthine permease [Alphaproteobacteria bacterium]
EPSQPGLAYGVEDRVPPLTLVLNALQHLAIITPIGLVFPTLVARAAGAAPDTAESVLAASLVALGIGSILMCARTRVFGSGFLAPSVFTAAYLPASLAAAAAGGLPLVFGMTVFAGLCEIAFSYLLRRFRALVPSEVAGLAVLMIGFTLGLLGFRLVFGLDPRGGATLAASSHEAIALGLGTLVLIVVLNVWCGGILRIFAVLIGVVAGYAAAGLVGLVDRDLAGAGLAHALVAWPGLPGVMPAFDAWLAPQFAIGALAAALRAMGDITTCQRINDHGWSRPDFVSIGNGLRADGLSSVVAGLLGSVGLNTFSGSIGLSQATGVTARRVGFAIGALFAALACVPAVIGVAAAIPPPITGAVLLFSSAFIVANGLQIIVARLLDARRVVTIGLALIFGISHDVFFSFYATLPSWIGTIASSSLVVTLVIALALNAVFRLGIKRTVAVTAPIDGKLTDRLEAFCEASGAAWGAQREVVHRLFSAVLEAAELAYAQAAPGGDFALTLTFDEFHIDATTRFAVAPERRADAAAVEEADEHGLDDLPMLLIRRFADRVTRTLDRGDILIRMRFDA